MNVVVGYLHKVIPAEPKRTATVTLMVDRMLSACRLHNIPVLLIVQASLRDKAKEMLANVKADIHFVAPEELEAEIRKYL